MQKQTLIVKNELEKLKMRAEWMISESRKDAHHACNRPEDECLGCDLMRDGLGMLLLLGDTNIYTA